MKITLHENINASIQKYKLNDYHLPDDYGVIYEEENLIAGFLYYTTNRFHPYSAYLHFNFIKENIDSKIIKKMFNELKVIIPHSSYILRLENNIDFYKCFLDDNNFIEIRRTYEPEIQINKLISYYNSAASQHNSINGKFELTDNLISKVQKVYKSTHEINPVGDISLNEWKSLITSDLDFENSIAIYNEDHEVIAFLFIFESLGNNKDIGWVYFKNEEEKIRLITVFRNILLQLEVLGINTINLEIDTTDKYAYELFSEFIINTEPSLVTFMRRDKSE